MGKTGDFSKKQLHLSLGSYFIGNFSSGIFNFILMSLCLKSDRFELFIFIDLDVRAVSDYLRKSASWTDGR